VEGARDEEAVVDDVERGRSLAREMIPPDVVRVELPEGTFGAGLADLALTNVFGRLWSREGLDRRARSLVTLGILIALGAEDELRIHLRIALRNGLTREELEEVVYHASGYAGFPAAGTARRIAEEVLDGG
jgi:4-carboxymuconolactone decarboxylase